MNYSRQKKKKKIGYCNFFSPNTFSFAAPCRNVYTSELFALLFHVFRRGTHVIFFCRRYCFSFLFFFFWVRQPHDYCSVMARRLTLHFLMSGYSIVKRAYLDRNKESVFKHDFGVNEKSLLATLAVRSTLLLCLIAWWRDDVIFSSLQH